MSVNRALHEAVAAIHLDDSSDFKAALYAVVKELNPHVYELLQQDTGRAYRLTLKNADD